MPRITIFIAAGIALALCAGSRAQQESVIDNPIERLQRKLERGELTLKFEDEFGYLRSVLAALDVPVSSQSLVFSKTSLAREYVSPLVPRAIYFSDDVYVAMTRGVPLEFAAVGGNQLPMFYTLDQQPTAVPRFERDTTCLLCHDPMRTGVTRLIMRSHFTDREGNAFQAQGATSLIFTTTDRTPFSQKWGGWYVTGTHGDQRHLGNMMAPDKIDQIPEREREPYAARMDRSKGANVTDLRAYFDTTLTLSGDSDIVALSVLAHQVNVQNLMADAARSSDVPRAAEALVRALLFVGESPLSSPIRGTTSFAADFQARGARDSQGRSLRELDLEQRLMRYPLSYLIYSASFEGLPPPVKEYVYTRLRLILEQQNQEAAFAHLRAADRAAILTILRDTKADFDRR